MPSEDGASTASAGSTSSAAASESETQPSASASASDAQPSSKSSESIQAQSSSVTQSYQPNAIGQAQQQIVPGKSTPAASVTDDASPSPAAASSTETPPTPTATATPTPAPAPQPTTQAQDPNTSSTTPAAAPSPDATTPAETQPAAAASPAPQSNSYGSPEFNPLSFGYHGAIAALTSDLLPSNLLPSSGLIGIPLPSLPALPVFLPLGSSTFSTARRPTATETSIPSPSASVSHSSSARTDVATRARNVGAAVGGIVAVLIVLLVALVFRPRMCRRRQKQKSVPDWIPAASSRHSSDSFDSMEKIPIDGNDDGHIEVASSHLSVDLGTPMAFPAPPSSNPDSLADFVPLPIPPIQTRQVPPPTSHRTHHVASTVFSDSASYQSFHVNFGGPPSSEFGGAFPSTPTMPTSETLSSLYSPGTWANLLASPDSSVEPRVLIPSSHDSFVTSSTTETLETTPSEDRTASPFSARTASPFSTRTFQQSPRIDEDNDSLYSNQTGVSGVPGVSSRAKLYATLPPPTRVAERGPRTSGEASGNGFPTSPLDDNLEEPFF